MAKFSITNFLPSPTQTETKLKIFDKTNVLKYTLDPNVSFFFNKANIVIIKIEDKNDINLDFSNNTEAVQALAKLNECKKKLTTTSSTTPTTPTVSTLSVLSTTNLNMKAVKTVNDGDLCCVTPINSMNISFVKVKVNGVELKTGGKTYPCDCYFSNDGVTARNVGDEKYGDLLYWNGSIAGYQLDEKDIIDFDYLIAK